MAYAALNIHSAKELIKTALETAINGVVTEDVKVGGLKAEDVVKVEYPLTIDEYKLNHPRGCLLVVFDGAGYKGTDNKSSKLDSYILQDRDIRIMVVCVINKKQSGMDPEDYVDFARETLSGIEVQVNRAENKVFPIQDEFIGEQGGEWRYAITFVVPTLNIEQAILDNQ